MGAAMSKITLVVPTSFIRHGDEIGPYFVAQAGLDDPGLYGYFCSNGSEWSIHIGRDKVEDLGSEGFTAPQLADDLRSIKDCALLVPAHDASRVKALLVTAGHKVKVLDYPGPLKTYARA